jgi:hypothetical protein
VMARIRQKPDSVHEIATKTSQSAG